MPRLSKGAAAPTTAAPTVDFETAARANEARRLHQVELTATEVGEAEVEEAYVPPRVDPPAYNPKKKPVTHIHGRPDHLWVSGFCQGEAQVTGRLADQLAPGSAERLHSRCPGAITSGNGTTTICGCPGHRDEHRCHICGHVEESGESFDADRRRCADVEACADRLHEAATVSASTPLARMIREVRAASRRSDAATPASGTPRGSSTRRVGRPCQCGCGLVTGGGLFRPGHDAKLKSTLQKAAHEGDVGAVTELVARGWPVPPTVPVSAHAAGVDVATPEACAAYIEQRVAERYASNGEQGGTA